LEISVQNIERQWLACDLVSPLYFDVATSSWICKALQNRVAASQDLENARCNVTLDFSQAFPGVADGLVRCTLRYQR